MTTSDTSKKRKRRPGRDHESHPSVTTEPPASPEIHAEPPPAFHDQPERKHVELQFVGSDVLKEKAPKVFDLAQTVADEWVNDGSFDNLKLGHPVAEMVASMGLREAKKIEKKLEEKGVFAMAKMGLEYAKNRWKK